jgi:hypothetical protein
VQVLIVVDGASCTILNTIHFDEWEVLIVTNNFKIYFGYVDYQILYFIGN